MPHSFSENQLQKNLESKENLYFVVSERTFYKIKDRASIQPAHSAPALFVVNVALVKVAEGIYFQQE